MTDRSQRLAHEFATLRALPAWMKRVGDIGHGRPSPMSPEDALDVARACEPAAPRPSQPHREDPGLGSRVEIRTTDHGQDRIVGSLEFLDDDELSIGICHPRVGHVAVHFPRVGFEMRPARQAEP